MRSLALPRRQRSERRAVQQGLVHLALIVLCLAVLVPFLWMVSTSLKPRSLLFSVPPQLIPSPPLWHNYLDATTAIPFFTYLRNSLYITLFNVVGNTLSSALVAYGFARLRWPGRNLLFGLVVVTMFLPGVVTLVPTYTIFNRMGWIGTFHPLTIPSLTAGSFYVFLLRQFFVTISEELSEAARLDGASELRIFWRIVLPLSKPAVIAVALFTFIAVWHDFMTPLIYLSDPSMWTLPIGLYDFIGKFDAQWNLLMAASVLFILPPMVLFFLGQRVFMNASIQATTLKG
jgi:ABC-type glycerol-3-phosphate transport system permease component